MTSAHFGGNMRNIILILAFWAMPLFAVEVKIHSLCDEEQFYTSHFDIDGSKTVLDYTIQSLNEHSLEYVAYDNGISKVFNSPIGMEALEYKSEKDLRSYGWCYLISSVDGLPSKMPNEITVKESNEKIHWFYGYAEMKDGKWIKFCEPVYKTKPAFICE